MDRSLLLCIMRMAIYRVLSSNHISSLAGGTFSGLPALTQLYMLLDRTALLCLTLLGIRALSSNQISDLASGTFTGLSSLTILYIGDGAQLGTVRV